MPMRYALLWVNEMTGITHGQCCLTKSISNEIHADSIFRMRDIAHGIDSGPGCFRLSIDCDLAALEVESPLIDGSQVCPETDADQNIIDIQCAFISRNVVANYRLFHHAVPRNANQFVLRTHVHLRII